jgi:predicted glycoside hydrolase/deacetylase ChbG (UPF0249 family)
MQLQAGVAYLVVNAGDYGYSEEVSCGILEAVRKGAFTASGVLVCGFNKPIAGLQAATP